MRTTVRRNRLTERETLDRLGATALQLVAPWTCLSCEQEREPDERRGDVCVDCANDAADAEQLGGVLPEPQRSMAARDLLEQLANQLDREAPFTRLGFVVLARKVLALLQLVHRQLDVAVLEHELTVWTAHFEDNARELATFIRCEIAYPTLADRSA